MVSDLRLLAPVGEHVSWRIVVAVLTIALGAIPATMLVYVGLVGLVFSLASLSTALLMLFAVVLGAAGTIGLWVSAILPKPATYRLIAGLVGLGCGHVALWPIQEDMFSSVYVSWLFISPGVVALAHLARAWVRSRQGIEI